ncbi:MAG: EAL domain-containing protein [Rhodocyclaceae bacterium]|nr:EAL domain-containing protein [Rhodocyclaceae bacterium]
MIASAGHPDPDEYRNQLEAALRDCAREPIHRIGSIQGNGVLVAFDAADWRVTAASANLDELLPLSAGEALGRPAEEVIGARQADRLRNLADLQSFPGASVWSVTLERDGRPANLDAQVFRAGGQVVVEIERQCLPEGDVFHDLFIPIRDALWRLEAEQDLQRYAAAVVDQVRLLTGFDRVMMYRFDANWDGEVIAETRRGDLDSYLGNRFPASDIPPQARELYTKNLVRLIADVDAEPIPLVTRDGDPAGIDLSFSWLRRMSPVHVEYLRNMGVKASLSISLVQNGRLWGLIACHHMAPRYVALRQREMDEFIGRVVSLKLIQMDSQERAAINGRIRDLLHSITEGIRGADDLDAVVARYRQEFLGVVRADGAIVSVGGTRHRIGEAPGPEAIEGIVAVLRGLDPAPVFHSEHLADLCAGVPECHGVASGMMVAPLDHQMRDFVMWFRMGILRTLRWAGQPNKMVVREDGVLRISPRESFDTWIETYRDKSMPWSQVEIDAANSLSLALIEVLAQRALRSREESYRLLAENSTDMIASIDLAGTFRFVSPASQELLGIPADDMLGRKVTEFIMEEDRPSVRRVFENLIEAGGAVTTLVRAAARDGRAVWVEATVKRTRGPSGMDELVMNARDVTQRHTYQLAIEEVHRRNARILDAAGDGLVSLNGEGRIVYANEVALRMLGRDERSVIGAHCCAVLCGNDAHGTRMDADHCPFLSTLRDGETRQGELAILQADGHPGQVAGYVCTPLREDGVMSGCVVVFAERGHGRARDEAQATDVIIEQASEAVMVTDAEGRITSVNRAFTEITGYSAEEATGKTPRILKSGVHTPHFYQEFWKTLEAQHRWVGEVWNRRRNGEIYPQWGSVTAVLDHEGRPRNYVAVFSDISKAKQAEEKLYYLANHDTLTGLPNRMRFSEQLGRAIERAKRTRASLAVAFVDLDRFKIINDTLGHAVGDLYLKKLAERLQASTRRQDTLARWGGDEFVIVLEDVTDRAGISEAVTRLLCRLAEPIHVEGQELVPTASVGISIFPEDGSLPGDLIKAADAAMYRAKELGRNRFEFYTERMQEELNQKFSLAGEIRRALAGGEFRLHFQPQVDARSGGVIGVEALARWQHPTRGLLGPASFIPLAEEIGLISEFGDWVLHESCRQMREWRDNGVPVPRVAVNVAPAQLKEGFVDAVGHALRESGIPAQALEIEITEGALEAGDAVRQVFERLRDLGVLLSVDDFGTGYSSLSHIKLFPITCFKIDKSFVDGIPQNDADVAIVRTILALGTSLHVEIVAEGVETAEQADFLRSAGVTNIQGFFYGRPMPPAVLAEFLGGYSPAGR